MTDSDSGREIVDDVRIFAVELCNDNSIVISVYGGPSNACGSVTFNYPSYRDAVDSFAQLDEWREQSVAVVVTTSEAEVSIKPRTSTR